MTKILIIAEHDGSTLNPSTAKCVTCATEFDDVHIDVAVIGSGIGDVAAEVAMISAVERVIAVDQAGNDAALAAILAPQIVSLADDYSHILGPSTAFGKDLMPRVAALLGVNQVSDIMSVESNYCFKRPIYAGNAVVTVEAPAEHKLVATVRTASYQAAEGGNVATIEQKDSGAELPSHTRFIELHTGQSDRPDLQTAARVVSGGRALASTENFELIYKLADSLGAAVGSSRAAVDAGYVPPETQVGQTGQIIAPDLYIAVGISGAIQHITGIKDAGTIVAINKDEEAPIFEIADIGLVGDLFNIVPELTDALS